MDLTNLNSWPNLKTTIGFPGLGNQNIDNALTQWETSGKTGADFLKTTRQFEVWNKRFSLQLRQITKIMNSTHSVFGNLGSLQTSIRNGISSADQLNKVKLTIRNLNSFQKNFVKFNNNLQTMTASYSKAFDGINRVFQDSKLHDVSNLMRGISGRTEFGNKLFALNKYAKIADIRTSQITGYKANLGEAVKKYSPTTGAISEQTKQLGKMFAAQGLPMLFGYGGQAWEQYGESKRQGGEILERQGLLTEGLKEFRAGTTHAALGRGLGQVAGMAGAGAMAGMMFGPIGAAIGLGVGTVGGLAAGAFSGYKDIREIGLKKQEMQWGLARNNEKALTNWHDYYDEDYLTGLTKNYRNRKAGSARILQARISDLDANASRYKTRAEELDAELSNYKGLYGKDFEKAPEEAFTAIGKLQTELDELTKSIQKTTKSSEALKNELKAGTRFDTSMRIGNISSATSTGLFAALRGNTQYDISSGHRSGVGYYDAEQSVLAKEHSSITKELERAKKESDGSEYYRTLIKQLETAKLENEKKQYQSGFNKDEMRSRMYKMRHGFTLFERDAGIANLMNNQYATTDDYNSKISEIRGWNNSIDAEIDKVLKWEESEAKLSRLNELNAEKSSNVSTINKLMGANKTDMSNLLRGIVGSSALTDNLGSMSYWAGKTNPIGRLMENNNGLLQQILNVLKESSEQYSPRFQ